MAEESRDALVGSDHTPPRYTDINAGDPPAYSSLYGELKTARKNASSKGHFLKSVCQILANTLGFTILMGILLAIPITMIIIGSLNFHRCPLQPFIPIWLIVAGSVCAFQQLISIVERGNRIRALRSGNESDEDENKKRCQSCYSIFNLLLGCFNVAWFIAGSIWVYSIYRPNTSGIAQYCDYTTYYFAFGLLSVIYLVMSLLCFCSCCITLLVGVGAD